MSGPLVDFTCRWFAVEVGYCRKLDECGIRLFGPRRNKRSPDGRFRWELRMAFWWYDFEGRRIWRAYSQLPSGQMVPHSRISVLH